MHSGFSAHSIGAACSIEEVLHHIDNAIQYGEDADVKIRDYDAPDEHDDM